MERDIKAIIRQDAEAGYKKTVLTNRGCASCAFASKAENYHQEGWLRWSVDSERGSNEKYCVKLSQWMRPEYWTQKCDCPNWEADGFRKTKRVLIGLRQIWK